MSILSKPFFHNEAAAFEYLEGLIWGDKPVCPKCGNTEKKIYALEGVRSKASKKNPNGVERHGLKKCGACRKQFTVRVGTVFESSHVPLHKWLQAAYLMMSSKKGISSKQLERTLEVTYKTAWFMSHRLREAMASNAMPPMGGEGSIVEADETYFGNKLSLKARAKLPRIITRDENGHILSSKPNPAVYHNKHIIVSLVERGGSVRSFKVDSATVSNVAKIVTENVDRQTHLMTDESKLYTRVGAQYANHEFVTHSHKEYARGNVTTNTIEGYFSIFKRGMKGVYQHCSEKHLHRYLAEYDFRYNNRERLGVNDIERTANALQGIVGKRLTYHGPN
ncbi:DDE transposase [Litorimonas cladophorae]|uniref:DDE transposase n=1 Tax=Litorimonas cladophorae TaxID=1220491 RepID=A0A918NC26_9PROT|nr:IS1595 family transposase [Litorimonas cladophorae]GGX57400.1 DDE transposase [Litorimonas cladophorae]